MLDNLKIGNRVEISLERDGSKINSYKTRLEIIDSNNEMFLSFPMVAGQYVKIPKLDNYIFVFYTDIGLFAFKGAVEKYVKIDGLPYVKINLLDKGKKVQRREFFRYEYTTQIEFSVISDKKTAEDKLLDDLLQGLVDDALDDTLDDTFIAITKDIGAGGLRFVTNEYVEVGTNIRVHFTVGENTIIVDAVTLAECSLENEKYKYQIRCKFTNMTEIDKEKIVTFIFNEQRKMLRTR